MNFRETAERVRNWDRWGPDDEIGTLNFITADTVRHAATLVRTGEVISLGLDLGPDGPQGGPKAAVSPWRTNPQHFMVLDGGDLELPPATVDEPGNSVARRLQRARQDTLFRFNEDYVVMPLQAATQWDSLAHAYYEDKLYNGYPVSTVTSFGAGRNSIARVAERGGITSRGVLLDVARLRGLPYLDGDEPITPEELDRAAAAHEVEIRRGDVVLVRTGWTTHFRLDGDGDYLGNGLSWECAHWLYDNEIAAIAADNKAVEASHVRSVPETTLPLHLLAQRDMGMMFGELFDLDQLADACAADGRYDFCLVAPALRFVGGVASPLNPVALR